MLKSNANSKLVYSDNPSTTSSYKLCEVVTLDFTKECDLLKMIERMRKKRQQSPRNKKVEAAEKKLREIQAEKEAMKARILAKVKAKIQVIEEKARIKRQSCIEPRITPRREKGELKGYSCTARIAGWPVSRYFAIKKYGEEHALLFAETTKEIFLQYIDYYCKNDITSELSFTTEMWKRVQSLPFEEVHKQLSPVKQKRREVINISRKEVENYLFLERMTMPLMIKAIHELPEIERLKFVRHFSKIDEISEYKISHLKEVLLLEVFSEV